MPSGRIWLLPGALLTSAVTALHVAIIVGGPGWYRFFGAGERMAQLAERGSGVPVVVTAGIAGCLAIAALYAFSGAGLMPQLPLLRPALVLIAVVYLMRGVCGIPVVLLARGPYAAELRARMPFMITTSLVSCAIGVCYAAGVASLRIAAPSP